MKILIPDVVKSPAKIEKEIFGKTSEIIVGEAKNASDIKDNIWSAVDAVLTFDLIQYTKDLLKKMTSCKIIVRVGVGYDNIDILAAKKQGIVVCNVPDYGTEEVADHTVGLLLMLTRGLKEYLLNVEKRNWSRANLLPTRLRGKTLGIIGLGRIGTATARRASVLGLNIVFYDPYLADGIEKALAFKRLSSLSELACGSDFISIHVPLTNETHNIIDENFFKLVKKIVYIINTERGELIDIKCLEKYMKKNIVAAAALDVLPIEPNCDEQSLIVALEKEEKWIKNRLIVTPHVAFYSPESYIEMRSSAAKEAKRFLEGNKPRNQVN